ncbi:MAG: TIGR04100 family radical SAM protein [Eubacterium sp.]|nr:TIGR04100 family radical SAM protein [Eubacterium sp.]
MADIIYNLDGGTYFNITNKCPCACAFCIRNKRDAVGSAKRLWFDEEPTFEEIKAAIDSYDFTDVDSAVFCGYGEPTNALDNLLKTANYVKSIKPSIKLRLNTNGLSDLINGRPTAKEICECIDVISVSLNDPDSEQYDKITKNIYPGKAFDAMLNFTRDCVQQGNEVRMTVVDVISDENIEKSRKLCESLGAKFIVRSFSRGR